MTTLLTVEDDRVIADMIKAYAENLGMKTWWAAEGTSALEIARREHPDVILLDVILPGLDGRDIMMALSHLKWAQRSVILFVTGCDQQHERLLGLELGADDYVTKPIDLESLFRKIDYLLDKKRSTGLRPG
jgi:DNA-binding response OmpR family regulator